MKLSPIIIILFSLPLMFFSDKENNSQVNKNNRIRYDGVYVFDNGSDTIIKDYESYRILIQSNLLPDSILSLRNPADTFTASPGSTYLEYLKFFPNGEGISTFSLNRDFNKAIVGLKKNRASGDFDFIFSYYI